MKEIKLLITIILSLSGIFLNAQISDKLTVNLADFRASKAETDMII